MDQTLAVLLTAVALFGTAIGLRFTVYILIPAGLAVLIASVMAQLIFSKMAGWGVQGTVGLLVLLNVGFAVGLGLRAGAALWSTKRIYPLFARPDDLEHKGCRHDSAGREPNSEGCGPTPTARMTPRDFAKESFRR